MNAITPRGSGGRPKTPPAPVEAPNTLRARQVLRMIFLVSEGTCVGLADGGKSILINDTPLVAADGTANFQGVKWEQRDGSPGQQPFAGIPADVSSITGVGAQVTIAGGPVVRTVDCTGADRVRVTVTVPALYNVNPSNGDQGPSSVEYRFEWRVAGSGAGWATVFSDRIEGKCVAPYPRQRSFAVPHNGLIDLRMVRVTADSTTTNLQNAIAWTSFATIIDQKLSYPGSAMVAVELDAEQFGSTPPTVTFDWKGMLCSVPNTYDPETATYTGGPGAWGGVLSKKYTTNPAWILYTLLTDPDWGCGSLLADSDWAAVGSGSKWLFHQIAQYCDESVPDGYGGTERRYTLNTWINSRDEAIRLASAIAATFRGMLYFGANRVVPVADMPGPVVKDVNPTNVIGGRFEYEGSSFRARHSVVKVRWRDPSLGYRETVEVVEDPELIGLIGVRETDYEAFGCTSRSLARRLGRWVLFTERYEAQTVRYEAGLDHAALRPGELIAVQDPAYAGAEYSGRLLAVPGATSVTLDRDVTLVAGQTYHLRVALPDGTMSGLIPISNALPATTRALTLGTSLPTGNLPEAGSVWTIVASNLAPRVFRVLAVEETSPETYAVTALEHRSGKFAYIDQGQALADDPYTIFRAYTGTLAAPTNPTAVEWVSGTGATTLCRVDFSWTPPADDPRVTGYEAQALGAGLAVRSETTTLPTVTFDELPTATYTFQVRSLGRDGLVSPWAISAPLLVDGLVDPPTAPAGLVATGGVRTIAVRWDASTDRLFSYAEVWVSSTSTFSAGATAGRIDGREFIHTGLLPNVTRYYWVRFVNTLGQTSDWVGPVSATTSLLVAADIQDGILDTAKFASGIEPVKLVTSVPTTKLTELIFNTTDGKLYRWDGTKYTAEVPAADVQGALAAVNFPANLRPTEVVSSLPSTGNFEGRMVYLTTDDKLYRWTSPTVTTGTAHWTTAVAAADVTGALAASNFPSNLRPIELVSALPSTDNFEGRVVYLTTDDKVYRWTSPTVTTGTAHWTTSVAAADVNGTLADAQIAAVAASKVTGQLSDTQIANLAAAKLTGQITGTQITDNAITAAKIDAAAVTTAKLAAGAVTADTIAANAITAAKISAGAVEAAKIAAGAISADKIAANAITADKVAANAVTADKIAASAITADKIAAGAVSAAAISANAITASKLFLGETTNIWLDYDLEDASGFASAGSFGFGEIANNQVGRRFLEIGSQIDATTVVSGWFPVEPGAPYALQGAGWVSGAGSITAGLYLEFGTVDAAGAVSPTPGETVSRVQNGTFALTTGWGTWSGATFSASLPTGFAVTAGNGFNGSANHLSVGAGATNATPVSNANRFSVSAGQVYLLTATVQRVSTPSASLIVRLRFFDGGNFEIPATNNTLTWTSTSGTAYTTQSVAAAAVVVPVGALTARIEVTTSSAVSLSGGSYRVGEVVVLKRRVDIQEATTTTNISRQTVNADSPAAARRARFVLVRGAGTGATARFGGFVVRRRMGGQLIVDGSITADKIDTNAVTADKIAAGSVSAAAIAAGVVSADKLAANAVTADKIAANAITSDKISANAITAGKIAAAAISTTELAAGAVRAANLASETLITQAAQLGTAVVGEAQIANAAIKAAKIGDLEVDTIKIKGNAVSLTVGGSWNGYWASTTPGTAVSLWVGDSFGGVYALYIRAVLQLGSWSYTDAEGAAYSGTVPGIIRVFRNGTMIMDYMPASDLTRVGFEYFAGGPNNYVLQILSGAGHWSGGTLAAFSSVEMIVQCLKR